MRLLTAFFVVLTPVITLNTYGAQGADESLESQASVRLADEFIRIARRATMTEPLDTLSIMAAVELVKEASKLNPQNQSILRSMIEVAQIADLPDLNKKATKELLSLAPDETPLQLARLRDAIEMTNTADQRMAVYEQLLSDGNTAQLDVRIASRLALDAAQLQRQLGNIGQFARWLAESVALDPANTDAMVLAAGFFGDETVDLYSRAELLAAAMLSNIGDTTLQVTLAEFLMACGDYKDANAIYQIVLGDRAGDDGVLSDGLLADITLCQWAAGDSFGALDTIVTRQISVDKKYRAQTRQKEPRLTPLELARIHAPLIPKLSVVRAAIYNDTADPSLSNSSLESALRSLTTVASLYASRGIQSMEKAAELYLQAAWVTIWFSDDVDTAQLFIDSVEQGAVITQLEKNRLAGWFALKKGETENAIEILSLYPDDVPSQAGLGLAFLEKGNTREAAEYFLNIAKNQGETILGVWSRKQLQNIIGTEFDIRPEIDKLRQLMVGVLQVMHDYVLDPRPVVGIAVKVPKRTFSPYEPINIEIQLTNNTQLPMSIAKKGPIHPVVMLEAELQMANHPNPVLKPIIIPITRQISIFPKKTLTVQVNLREYWPGGLLNKFPTKGASLKLRATINFKARKTRNLSRESVIVYEPDMLGATSTEDGFRVDGVRLTDVWLKDAIAKAGKCKTIDDLTSLVLLTWVIGEDIKFFVEKPLITPPPGEEKITEKNGDRLALQDDAIATVLTVFPRLDPVSQSWVVATMSNDPSVEAVAGMFKNPQSTISQLAWMIRFVQPDVPDEALDDQRLLSSMSSDNPTVKTVANWVYSEIERVSKQREAMQLGESYAR